MTKQKSFSHTPSRQSSSNKGFSLRLPANTNTADAGSINLFPGRQLVIIGANGTGKTRFANTCVEACGNRALLLSALDGLYRRREITATEKTASLRKRFNLTMLNVPNSMPSTLELMLAQVMHDEMVNLINYKLRLADGYKAQLGRTRLDTLAELWKEIFPGNKVLVDSGKMLFSRVDSQDESSISSVRLSDGERAVLYHIGGVLYAPKNGIIFVETPEIFLHPTITAALWNRLEALRADCSFVYITHDPEFAASRNGAQVLWIRDCDSRSDKWDYVLMPPEVGISKEIYASLTGSRKPVLFIEGDSRSIDAHLYPLIFPDYTVRSLGSCNKVIETTRTLNDLSSMHKMDSMGIVDRDRRNKEEVDYLRRKNILVPEVAEIENIFLLKDVIMAMATLARKDAAHAFAKVRKAVMHQFHSELHAQALQHVRHRVKRTVEYRVDSRFDNIDAMEQHLKDLIVEMAPRKQYDEVCREFSRIESNDDYDAVLQVFNQKSLLINSNVAPLCGFKTKDEYIAGVIALLRTHRPEAETVRAAIRRCLKVVEHKPIS